VEKKTKLQQFLDAGLLYIWFPYIYSMISLPPGGTRWIYDWMQFIPIMIVPVYFLVYLLGTILINKKKKECAEEPKEEQAAKPRKRSLLKCIPAAIGIVAMFAFFAYILATSTYTKVERYLKSPDGRHKAVVLNKWGSGADIYPVKALLFYEDDKGVNLSPYRYAVSLLWKDNNTLEITRIEKDTGEISTDYLRW